MTEDETIVIPSVVEEEEEDNEESIEKVDVESLIMSSEEKLQKRLAKKPYIDHLEDGVTKNPDDTFDIKFKPIDRIVVERMCVLLRGNPWLNTRVYSVRAIDEATGLVYLEDEEMMHHSVVNFKSTLSRIKLAPAKGDPFKVVVPKVIVERADGTVGPRRRGRPKGSKSRSRNVIEQERRVKKASKKKKRSSHG